MTITELYRLFPQDTPDGEKARLLLAQTHWYSSIADFDPKTSEALPRNISSVLKDSSDYGKIEFSPRKTTSQTTQSTIKDRLWRITEHVRPSLEKLFRTLNESPRREHALLHIRAVRELDTSSFLALSRRPGRTIREKLAGKPYLQAVRRFQSVDLPENRLLKAFAEQLAELLELRIHNLGEKPDELLEKIRSWLMADETKTIRRWDNLPPNNTLLSHRHYRAVYDAWRWLQTLDDDITTDMEHLDGRQETKQKWLEYGEMYAAGQHLFAEMPVLFNYDEFEILPWTNNLLFIQVEKPLVRQGAPDPIDTPACIDLSELYPKYATIKNDKTGETSGAGHPYSSVVKRLPSCLLWQRWQNANESVDIELFNADAAYLHPDSTIISSFDLLFSKKHSFDHLDSAARAFANKLREIFKNDSLLWLLPDYLNDFELEITRRNLNACFPKAEPIPRSIAAIFEKVDFSRIRGSGYSVVVIDSLGGKHCATKLEARFNQELAKRLPETYGFYWERHPPIILQDTEPLSDTESDKQTTHGIITVDAQDKWHDATYPKNTGFIEQDALRQDKRIGYFTYLITLTTSPIRGGIKFYPLQQRAGEIALWRDYLPELSFTDIPQQLTEKFFWWGDFNLVENVYIIPRRGNATDIPIERTFTLPVNPQKPQDHYRFGLRLGEGQKELNYIAYLKSPAFPLKENTECKLKMTYNYGADDPYELRFIPQDPAKAGFQSVKVEWRLASEDGAKRLEDLPIPTFPSPKTWEDFQKFPDRDGNGSSNLLERMERDMKKISDIARYGRISGVVTEWINRGHDNVFCFIDNTFIHKSWLPLVPAQDLPEPEDTLSFYKIENESGKFSAEDITIGKSQPTHRFWANGLRFRTLTIWNHGNSLSELDAPDHFRHAIQEGIRNSISIIESEDMPETLKEELFFFLCCLHKDAPEIVADRLLEITRNKELLRRYNRNIAFAIGNAELSYQKKLLDNIVDPIENEGRTKSITMEVLSIALWRSQRLIFMLSDKKLKKICTDLHQCILFDLRELKSEISELQIQSHLQKGLTRIEAHEKERFYQENTLCKHLELLLALLRSRENFKMFLAPQQEITKEFVRLIDNIYYTLIDKNIELKSRISLQIEKPAMFSDAPDLLYALRMYLTGDSGANSITISGVRDDE